MKIKVIISVGELLDKISILQIKSNHTDNPYVIKELKDLIQIAKDNQVYDEEEIQNLLQINSNLWKIEDCLRDLENKQIFDDEFIQHARLVYIINDKRAEMKKKVDKKYNSFYQEIKCYN